MRHIKYNNSFDLPKSFSNRNLQTILQFYLFECPVKGKSNRGRSFQDFGYIGSSAFGKLKSELLRAATPSLSKNYIPCSKKELPNNFDKSKYIYYPDEYCIFLMSDEKSVIDSLFAAIRNAFAHGSFNVKSYKGNRIYYFSNFKNYEKARIVLYEQTLLSWIKIIENGGSR